MDIQKRLDAFVERGYRPSLKTHVLLPNRATFDERVAEGWTVVDLGGDPHLMGWVVDAYPADHARQTVIGATARTIEEALAYAERELDKYAPEGK